MNQKSSSRVPDERTQESFTDDDGQHTAFPEIEQGDDIGRQMLSRLGRIIEGDIIPRLMLAFDSPRTASLDPKTVERLRDSVDEFVHLLIAHDASVATRYIGMLRADGTPLSALYLDLLAPAARRLGKLWEDDECSFTDVTVGVCRMHQVLLEFSRCFDATTGGDDPGRRTLIIPVPGEQHTFGIFMVIEFLRRAGWNCFSGTPGNASEFQEIIDSQAFDVIGFSISAERNIDTAQDLVNKVRDSQRNADTTIVIGGRLANENPDLADTIGADATASSGEDAVAQFNRLFQETKQIQRT
ncbi:MAG: cobalamin B12-binding domain-containing protein [Pseudomonadota bacterium]